MFWHTYMKRSLQMWFDFQYAIKPFGAETEIFQVGLVYTMAVDALVCLGSPGHQQP